MIIYNSLIPFKGYTCINICGILFIRSELRGKYDAKKLIAHEKIHTRQIIEMLVIGFYAWYCIEYFFKFFIYKNNHETYKHISFEQEAYMYADDDNYLTHRHMYKWLSYLK